MKHLYLVIILVVVSSVNSSSGTESARNTDDLLEQPGAVSAEFIFAEAPHPQCHASTIAATPTGLVAAWFGGTRERDPDVGIWVSRRLDGGWTTPVEAANGIQYARPDGTVHRQPCWNPVLFQPKDGPLLLFFKCGPDPSAWWGMLTNSSDGGVTWSEPRRLPEGIIGPVKNKPIQLADGTIVCPSSTEHDGWRLHLETTDDLGKTWTRSGPLNDGIAKGAIQPSLLFHKDGRWQMLARDRRRKGNVWTTWSTDKGQTWSELESTGLPNPSSGTDAVTLADGRQLLVYNHRQRPAEDAPTADSRGILNVAISDDGVHWQAALVLEDSKDEYSYPAVIQTHDGLVHITYTWHRKRIMHVIIDPAKLRPTPIVDGKWPLANREAD
ncbi:MAG: sialidase family protein [Pirellulales bacterium]